MKQLNFFSFPEHLSRLSSCGDPLEALSSCVDFEIFRRILDKGLRIQIVAEAVVLRMIR